MVPIDNNQSEEDNPYRQTLVLKNQLVKSFSLAELRDICFELGLDPENARHHTKPELAVDILRFAADRGKTNILFSILRDQRPNEKWPDNYVFPNGIPPGQEMTFPIIQFGFVYANESSSRPVPKSSVESTQNTLVLEVLESIDEPDLEGLVASEREVLRLDYLSFANSFQDQQIENGQLDIIRAFQNALQIAPKTQQQYDEECDGYLQDFSEYLLEKSIYDKYKARYREIDFQAANIGRAAADDIRIEIHFPDEFIFRSEDKHLIPNFDLEEPIPPSRPEVHTDFLTQIRFPYLINPDLSSLLTPKAIQDIESTHSNVHGPYIEESNSTKVTFKIDKLIPKAPGELLDEVCFIVSTAAIGKTWPLRYTIFARQLPEPVSGELYLEVRSYHSLTN